jgi:hypothetical protein
MIPNEPKILTVEEWAYYYSKNPSALHDYFKYMDEIIAAKDAEIARLRALLGEWLNNGCFLAGNSEEKKQLVEETRNILELQS